MTLNHGCRAGPLIGFLFLLARVQRRVSCVITGHVKLDSVNANAKKRVLWCYVHWQRFYQSWEMWLWISQIFLSAKSGLLVLREKAWYDLENKKHSLASEIDGALQDITWHKVSRRSQPWVVMKDKPKIDAAVGFWRQVDWSLDTAREPTWGSLRLSSECLGHWDGEVQIECEEGAFHGKTEKHTNVLHCYRE